jgi:hypothetical protein
MPETATSRVCCARTRADLQHVAAHGIYLVVELVAKLVDASNPAPYRGKIPRIQVRKQVIRLLLQMTAAIGDQVGDPNFDARQRRIVRRRALVRDDGVDHTACFGRLALDFGVLGVKNLLARAKQGFVRRLLHFCNDHATERQPALERKHGNPRQMRIGRNISCRELVQQMDDLSDHDHRQDRCRDHQDDQPDGNRYDPSADRLLDHRSGESQKALNRESVGNISSSAGKLPLLSCRFQSSTQPP